MKATNINLLSRKIDCRPGESGFQKKLQTLLGERQKMNTFNTTPKFHNFDAAMAILTGIESISTKSLTDAIGYHLSRARNYLRDCYACAIAMTKEQINYVLGRSNFDFATARFGDLDAETGAAFELHQISKRLAVVVQASSRARMQ
jgi:hypothetical protein